jgi:hypothetical protein
MPLSITNLIVLLFLFCVGVWLFARRGKLADRIFLAVAAAIYIAIMAATIWKFNARESTVGMLSFEIFMETIGLILVGLSRKLRKKNPEAQKPTDIPA